MNGLASGLTYNFSLQIKHSMSLNQSNLDVRSAMPLVLWCDLSWLWITSRLSFTMFNCLQKGSPVTSGHVIYK